MQLSPLEVFDTISKHIGNVPVGTGVQMDVETSSTTEGAAVTTTVTMKLVVETWPASSHEALLADINALQ